jgi:anti-sigma regulatory factor (Ser/Thr protein kinase)
VWGLAPEVVDGAVVVADELSSNAMLHTRAAATLHLCLNEHRLRIEVSDISAKEPRRYSLAPGELDRGLGLNIVANLADGWGYERAEAGKTVWCEFLVWPDSAN